MNGLLIAIVFAGICAFAYKRRNAKLLDNINNSKLDEKKLESIVMNVEPEKIDTIQLSDVTSYFKMLNLKKGEDVPFIFRVTDINNSLVMATFHEGTQSVQNLKFVVAGEVAADINNILGDQRLVVLN